MSIVAVKLTLSVIESGVRANVYIRPGWYWGGDKHVTPSGRIHVLKGTEWGLSHLKFHVPTSS